MQNIRNFLFSIVLLLASSGCAQLSHLDQLLTLKALSDNRDLQHQQIEKQDKRFSALLVTVQDDSIRKFIDKGQFLKEFGSPILTQPSTWEGKSCELWLYRYAVKYFSSEKVYLYFDDQDRLLAWELVKPENKEMSAVLP